MMFSEAHADSDMQAVDDYLAHHDWTMADADESQFVHALIADHLKAARARIFFLRDNAGQVECAGHVVAHGGGLEWQGVTTRRHARGQDKATDLACFARWTYFRDGYSDFGCVVRILPRQGINRRALRAFEKAGFYDTDETLNVAWSDHPVCRHLKPTLEADGTYRVRRLAADASTFHFVRDAATRHNWR